MNNKTFYLACD